MSDEEKRFVYDKPDQIQLVKKGDGDLLVDADDVQPEEKKPAAKKIATKIHIHRE